MEKILEEKLKFLRLTELTSYWEEMLEEANSKTPSYTAFVKQIIDREYVAKRERSRLARLKSARLEELLVIETYPFDRQANLSKKKILDHFDSNEYITKNQNLILIGPTGVGKTGIATSLLVHAINQGYSGRFISFPDLLTELYQSSADHSETKVLNKFLNYDCLLVDEMGYIEIDPHQAGLFFTLMKKRHKKSTTIVTTQLGFKDWPGFLKNENLTAALVDRLTEKGQGQIINMGKCVSLRDNQPVENKLQ
jgi:DNA replication protein DnaC